MSKSRIGWGWRQAGAPSSRPAGLRPLFCDVPEPQDHRETELDIENRCQLAGEKYGLSSREIEVIQLMCRGRDKAYIAETLFISENTVRSYSKNAYRKLGVHSKREMLDLVSGE